jgi:D-aminopeptidase
MAGSQLQDWFNRTKDRGLDLLMQDGEPPNESGTAAFGSPRKPLDVRISVFGDCYLALNRSLLLLSLFLILVIPRSTKGQEPLKRPRARDIGLITGTLPAGPLDAITDVPGVLVGQVTLVRGDAVRTGLTVVLPHGGNLFVDKVPGAVFVGNAFGKIIGETQVEELGEIETPIALTSTLNVARVADAMIDYMLQLPGNETVHSINPVVAETNDGFLNDIRSRYVGRAELFQAIETARGGPVGEGAIGAGTGTVAFGFKGGIGTSSRRVGGYTVGVLVQSNFGGVLQMNGAPVGRELAASGPNSGSGSIIMVVATDAPVDARNLRRMAARTMFGLARTGSSGANGSGDYGIAFSTVRNPSRWLSNDEMSPLFLAVIDATEEAIYNSLLAAVTTSGNGHTVEALPIDRTLEILRKYHAIP